MTPTELLHPELAAFVANLAPATMTAERIAMLRENPAMPPTPPLPDDMTRADLVVPGDPPVPVRVNRPKGVGGPLPCLVVCHGGGLVLGTHELDDLRSTALGIVTVSVGYRLAPESAYPAAFDDCYGALLWVFGNADQLGIDARCVGIGGTSAGGGLAAAVALAARDRGEVSLAYQLLECPMIDDRQITHSSQVDGLPIWSRESNEFGWRSYLGDLYGTPDVPYIAAAARATDLSGLPPAFVNVGSIDGFLDEDVDYALRLDHAGVPCELHVYPGACHGYQMAPNSAIARQSARDSHDWLRRQFDRVR